MKALKQADIFQSFGKNNKKLSRSYIVVHPQDSPEQDFHPLSSRRHSESPATSGRSHSEDKKWAGGTFGKEGGHLFLNHDLDLGDQHLNSHRSRGDVKEDLNNISRIVLEKSRDKSAKNGNQKDLELFQRECVYRDISNYGLKRYEEGERHRRERQKLKEKFEKVNGNHAKKNGIVHDAHSTQSTHRSHRHHHHGINNNILDGLNGLNGLNNGAHHHYHHHHNEKDSYRSSEETKESKARGKSKDKNWPKFRLSFEKIPTINFTSIQGSSNRDSRPESTELEKAIAKLRDGQENIQKDKRIKELENYVEELLGNIDIYSSQLGGYIEILRKDLLENNLYVLDLKDNIYLLLECISKIMEIIEDNQHFLNASISMELGQEMERCRGAKARVEADLENIVDVVKINEDCATRLAEFTSEKLANVELMKKAIQEGRAQRETTYSSLGSLGKMIKDIGGNNAEIQNGNMEQLRRSDPEELRKLREELKDCTKIIEMKDKLILRQKSQLKDLEEVLAFNINSENGNPKGLKNTAKKIIDLQKKTERSEKEKEVLEWQIRKLLKGKDDLERALNEVHENNEKMKTLENELRDNKVELRKMKDKNEALKELHSKNENLIATLHSLNNDLKTEKQALLQRIKIMEEKEAKSKVISRIIDNSIQNTPRYLNVDTKVNNDKGFENFSASPNVNSVGHQKYSFGNHLDDLFTNRISSIPNEPASELNNHDLLGIWSEPKTAEKPLGQNFPTDLGSDMKSHWIKNGEHLSESRTFNSNPPTYTPDSELLTNKILFGERKDTLPAIDLTDKKSTLADLVYQADTPHYSDGLSKQTSS